MNGNNYVIQCNGCKKDIYYSEEKERKTEFMDYVFCPNCGYAVITRFKDREFRKND